MLVIVTGVCGTGKTTIGKLIAAHFSLPFFDADDFHPEKNIQKMSKGFPLNDEDRMPWLKALATQLIHSDNEQGAVLACSALKEAYRSVLKVSPKLQWVHLKGSREIILERMEARKDHYMKPEMLDSQMATWEEPEYGLKLSIIKAPDQMLQEALIYLTT